MYQFQYGGDGLDVTKQKHLNQLSFLAQNEDSILARLQINRLSEVDDLDAEEAMAHMKHNLKAFNKLLSGKSKKRPGDPTMAQFNPSRCVGATSEAFAQKIAKYVDENPDKLLKIKGDDDPSWKKRKHAMSSKVFRMMANVKYLRSMVEPGEAVGLLASQG